MPPKIKTSREMIVEAGYNIIDKDGFEALNCRALANDIGCSTQPVYSRFPNMDELKAAVFEYACERLEKSIAEAVNEGHHPQSNDKNIWLETSVLHLTELARNHRNIFKLIYLSEFCSEKGFLEEREKYQTNQMVINELEQNYHLSKERALDIFERLSLLTHGICTVLATTAMDYENDKVLEMVKSTLEDAVN